MENVVKSTILEGQKPLWGGLHIMMRKEIIIITILIGVIGIINVVMDILGINRQEELVLLVERIGSND